MFPIKVAAAALNQTALDWERNKRHILGAISDARAAGVSILCLPELCITGYGCEDAFLSPGVHRAALDVLLEILPETRGMIVSVGLPIFHGSAVYNACCLVDDGKILGFVAKQALAGDGIHYEPRWFKAWPAKQRSQTVVGSESYPIGDLYFDCGGVRIGFEICEDAWIAHRPGAELMRDAVDVILNPSASHFAFGKLDVRRRFVLEGSRAFGVSYVYANLLGNEAGRAIYDGDTLIATGGSVVAQGERFSLSGYTLISAVVDVDLTRTRRAWLWSFQPKVASEPGECVQSARTFPDVQLDPPVLPDVAWERSLHRKEEEFTRAVTLALLDYMEKSHSSGFVVSLSGGADSSAVAVLVWLASRFRGTVIPLTTVYQSTKNSSETTRSAARTVAGAIGARHLELDVDAMVQGYTDLVSHAVGRELSWERDDIALQNIQARARAPGVWMLANLSGALLLSTSNRSEAAVGYATMDGDTAGGLSPIAGIDKAFLRRWLSWMEKTGPEGVGPLPELSVVTVQAPTAELRPLAAAQTDEADLMPYDLLDAIERAAIRDKRTPLEVYRLMKRAFPAYAGDQLVTWVERFFRLWSQNQWKRERYAPSFHVDDENLDPKTWCRFPILSGGFERELAQLRAAVEKEA